jgi:iron complex outermembrane receptor protein
LYVFIISLNKMKHLYSLILLFIAFTASAQKGDLHGTIRTQDGQPAAFVNILIKESGQGTTSSEEGFFAIRGVQAGEYTLVSSFIGLQTLEQKISIKAGEKTTVNFTLSEDSKQLQEIVISDSRGLNEFLPSLGKGTIKVMDLPQSVMVIDKVILDRQQTLRLSDVLMNTNGVYVMGTTGGTQEEIAGRGFAFSSSNTFKNGSRFNNAIMPEVSALEKVEILKGSSAILFGQVAAGGVLNLVTKKPKFEKGGQISFRTGSYDFYKPTLDVYGALDKGNHTAYRFNTSYENAGSFRDQVKSERIYFNPSFLIKAGKKTQILVEGDYLKDNRTLDYGTGAVNYEVANLPRNRFLGASWSYFKAEQKSASVSVMHEINAIWQLKAMVSYQGMESDLFGTTRPNASGILVKTDGTWARGLQRAGTSQDYFIAQFDANAKFNTGALSHTILLGADADKYSNTNTAFAYINPAATGTIKNVYDTINIYNLSEHRQRNDIPEIAKSTLTKNPVSRNGLYVQDLIGITSNIKFLAGLRYTSIISESNIFDYNKKTTSPNGYYDDAFTPRFGLVYQPVKEVSIFTSYANSFSLNTGIDNTGAPLKPSFIDQYEAGLKTDLLDGSLSANVTAYQIINSNSAQTILTSSPKYDATYPNAQELAGEVTSKGIEVDIMSKPINGFSLIAGYSFNDTRYTKSNIYINNSRLRYNPSHTANASVYYNFTGTLKGLNAGIIGFYVGNRVAGRSTRTTIANDSYKLMTLPDYVLFDASIGYSFDPFSVRVKVSNLLNQLSYNVHDDNSVNPIAPRMFSTTISYKF